MERITFEVEFVTPCFLGGADNTATAEWRAASIRGQLRWWFRAVAGAGSPADLAKVVTAETRLFGSTSQASSLRVSAVGPLPAAVATRDRCCWGRGLSAQGIAEAFGDPASAPRLEIHRDQQTYPSNPIHYLAYGPVTKSKFARARIEPGQAAKFMLQLRGRTEPRDRECLEQAIWLWLHLGAIGARSRKGFGSLACTAATEWNRHDLPIPCTDVARFKETVKALLAGLRDSSGGLLPEWSHLSARSAVFVGRSGQDSWERALELVGCWLVGFRRRYGTDGDLRLIAGTSVAGRDYEWAAPNGNKRPDRRGRRYPPSVPDRAGFGLPLPFGESGETVTWHKPDPQHPVPVAPDKRRASPLLVHIAKLRVDGAYRYFPILTHLPARLVPQGADLVFKEYPAQRYAATASHDRIVRDFLDDLADPSKGLIEGVQ